MPEGYSVPPPGSPLSKVTVGMNDTDVRRVLGEPTGSNAYMTGKAWIPFYYGPDTHRSDWMYAGKGRVVVWRTPAETRRGIVVRVGGFNPSPLVLPPEEAGPCETRINLCSERTLARSYAWMWLLGFDI